MKLTTAPLFVDLDSSGNNAPTVTPAATVQPLTFTISGLEGRTEDLWNYIQATWVRVTWTLTQASSATVCNRDKLFGVVDSFNSYSQVLGDVVAQRSGQGAAVGLVDQVLGGGYEFPTPMANQVSATPADYTIDTYFRIPYALDCLGRPQDTGIWAPLFEKGKLVVNMSPTTADFFQTKASIKASAATVRSWLEVVPFATPQIHAPSKFVRYEFNTAGTQLKLNSFGAGDGMLGVNPGARLSFLAWLSSNNLLGGVDTIEKWSRISLAWRHQKVTNNPDALMAAFLATVRTRGRVVGSEGSTVTDDSGWPYQMGATVANSVLDSEGLFYPIVWPGSNANISGFQKQVGDLQIDAGFTSNPNGTHVFRTLEHYQWQTAMVARIMGMMGYDTKSYTAEPKTSDNTDPRLVPASQLWGVPLRIVSRAGARLPVL